MFRVYSDLLAAAGVKQSCALCFWEDLPSRAGLPVQAREFPEPFRSRSRLRQNDIRRKVVRDGADATNVESGEKGGCFGIY
jgi:hypothetical protein